MPHGSIQNPYVNKSAFPGDDRSTTNIDTTSTPTCISLRDNHDDAPDVKTTGNPNVDPVGAVHNGQRRKDPQEDFQPFSDDSVLESLARKATKTILPRQTVPSVPRHPAQELSVTQSPSPEVRMRDGDCATGSGGANEAPTIITAEPADRERADGWCSAGAPSPAELPCHQGQDPNCWAGQGETQPACTHVDKSNRIGQAVKSSNDPAQEVGKDEVVDRAGLERGSRGLSTPISLGAGEMTSQLVARHLGAGEMTSQLAARHDKSRSPTGRGARHFFANAINDHNKGLTVKALPREQSSDTSTDSRSKQAILLAVNLSEVARPPLTVTNVIKSTWIQNDQGQKMVQHSLNLFQAQIYAAKSHSDNLLVYVKADADLKLKDKEQELILLRDFVGQSAEQCKQLQNYVQNAHNYMRGCKHGTKQRNNT